MDSEWSLFHLSSTLRLRDTRLPRCSASWQQSLLPAKMLLVHIQENDNIFVFKSVSHKPFHARLCSTWFVVRSSFNYQCLHLWMIWARVTFRHISCNLTPSSFQLSLLMVYLNLDYRCATICSWKASIKEELWATNAAFSCSNKVFVLV